MDLDTFAEFFISNLFLTCLVYDNRCFGDSDGQPRQEIVPALQVSDYSDAITYTQTQPEVNTNKIGIWGNRHSRAKGNRPSMLPVVDAGVHKPSALPSPDSFEFFTNWEKKSEWKNEVTVKLIEPTPLLMPVAENDVLTPTTIALESYSRALEPKQIHILPEAGHLDGYSGPLFERNSQLQLEFLRKISPWMKGRAGVVYKDTGIPYIKSGRYKS
ncbi:hypothetical protein SCUP515_10497 [Seiridium cupressi]